MPCDAEAIRRQLERVLSSEVFSGTSRLRHFLAFVVERSLAGEADRLKEYVIGVEVFDRDAGYDPRVDSIVRVEAARLRTKIGEYYRGAGRDDPVVITIAKGGYAPSFEQHPPVVDATALPAPTVGRTAGPWRTPLGRVAAGIALGSVLVLVAVAARVLTNDVPPRSLPRIAVLPIAPYSTDPADQMLATRLTEGVTAELVRRGGLEVAASASAARYRDTRESPRDIAQALRADLLLQARLLLDSEGPRVEARLVDGPGERKLWVETFAGPADDLDALEARIAAAVAAAASAAGTAP